MKRVSMAHRSGFGSEGSSETLKQTHVPLIKWKSPPMFILDTDWHVVAGEQSEETGTQKHRESTVSEVLYSCASAIPSSPAFSPGLEECDCDDRELSRIPVIPIEEVEAVDCGVPSDPAPICSNSVVMNQDEEPVIMKRHNTEESKLIINEKVGGMSTGLEADVHAAASAAFTAIMKSNEKGSLIDTDLLVKILRDPKMIEKLSKDSGVSSTANINPVNEPKSAPSVSVPTIECQSTMSMKPMYESLNIPNLAQHTNHFSSNTFLRSEEVLNIPIYHAKPLNQITNQFHKDLKFPASSFSVSKPLTTFDLPDKSTLMPVISSIPTSVSISCSNTAYPSTLSASLSDTINPRMPITGQEFSQLVPSSSFSTYSRFNDISSNFFTQTDRQLLHHSVRETSQLPLHTNGIALSPNLDSGRTELVSPTCREIRCLSQENHSLGTFSQYLSSTSDRPLLYPVSSEKTSVVQDKSYLKSLIELHGVEKQVSSGEYIHQYRPKALESIDVSGGEAKAKLPPCRYFNSSQGCRKGPSCPFQHDHLLKMRAGSLPDSHNSKRFKLSREIS